MPEHPYPFSAGEQPEAEPLPVKPLNGAEALPEDGVQDVSQDADVIYESEVDDGDGS